MASQMLLAQTKIVAHRGYWNTEGSAQNSVASLKKAHEIGCWGSEFDVWMTADGVCVLWHDAEIDGKRVDSVNYADIRDKKLSNGETLPTLEQFLWEACHLTQIKLVCEIKPHATPEQDKKCADEVLRLVKKYGVVDQTEYISFSMTVCERLIEMGSKILDGRNGQRAGKTIDKANMQVAYLSGNIHPRDIRKRGLTGIDYHFDVMAKNPSWMMECARQCLTVNVWTVNDLNLVWSLYKSGVDYITTDRPVEALKLTR